MVRTAEDEKYKKLTEYLTQRSLSWILNDLLTHRELFTIVNEVRLDYKDKDIQSIPPDVILKDLAGEFFNNPQAKVLITRIFLRKRLKEISKFSKMDLNNIRDYIGDGKNIFKEHRVGKVLWALLIDERKDINKLAVDFIDKIQKIIYELDKSEKDKQKKLINVKTKKINIIPVESSDVETLKQKIRELEEKIKAQFNTVNQLTSVNKNLKKNISLFNEKYEAFQKEKKILIQELENAKKLLIVQEKELKRFERESKKLKDGYRKNDDSSSVILLERKNLQLRGEIARWEIKFRKLQKELGIFNRKKKMHANRVGVFVDVQNIYYGAKIGYQAKLNFHKLLRVITKDRYMETAIAYIVQTPEINQAEFIKTLDRVGYTVKSKDLRRRADGSAKGDWDLGMAMDIISYQEKLDVVVLVSGDGDFIDLVSFLKNNNIIVEVAAFQHNASKELLEIADTFYPIEEDMII